MKQLKLIFMGTPSFALPSLDLLCQSSHSIKALIVPPDRPCGRGGQVRPAPVKEWALQHRVEVAQPGKINEEKFLFWLKEKKPDLIITVAFGQLLPPTILQLPPLGCINLHASYLPAYRGAAPIHRVVINGLDYSGVSIIAMSPELDAGDIIMQEKEAISPYDTVGMLHDRLAVRGAALLLKTVGALVAGTAKRMPQEHAEVTYAPPLSPEDERLDWSRSATEIYNRIRGLNPWPGAYTVFEGKRIKIWRAARPEANGTGSSHQLPGTIIAVDKDSLTVATGEGFLTLLDLQPAGKKTMDAGSFCCGYRIEPGSHFDGE